MHAHGAGRRLVQHQGEMIKRYYRMDPAGQVMEERREIAVQADRFRNRQQRAVSLISSR